ncbi:MAG: hypothetical protein H0W11_08655 [Gemmatimonadetes bacterium]|jgi:hypothetical protein|nr:hypothetical protein [Gemmatimonadota bacterium]
MWYRNAEDRLNPIAPEGVDDTTLGGYVAVHGRAPSFDGIDGAPFTVGIETEPAEGAGAEARWAAYLVFLRWAENGTAVMGHLETGDLAEGRSEVEARRILESLPLSEVKTILDETIRHKQRSEPEA